MSVLRLGAVFLLLPQTAFAEVCDKIAGDDWFPARGPIDTLTWTEAAGVAAVSILGIALCKLLRSEAMAKILSILAFSASALNLFFLIPEADLDEVTVAAIKEGCLSAMTWPSNLGRSLLFLMAAIAFTLLAGSWIPARQKA